MAVKRCFKCREAKNLNEYFKDKCTKDGFGRRCKSCETARHSEYARKNQRRLSEYRKEHYKRKPDLLRARNLRREFGISIEVYSQMLTDQNGVCAICRRPERNRIKGKILRLAVDHCHTTGKVRGLLCTGCNTSLGGFEDDVGRIQNAAEYLRRSS